MTTRCDRPGCDQPAIAHITGANLLGGADVCGQHHDQVFANAGGAADRAAHRRRRAGHAVRPGRQRQAEEPAVTNTPPGMYQISLDDGPRLDSPEHFREAGRALADRYPGTLTAHRAVEALTWLAGCGYLVSTAEHDRCREEHAARLSHAEQAADELVSRLDAAGER